MAFNKFKADRRLWFWISFMLFAIPWLLPIVVFRGSVIWPAGILVGQFSDANGGDVDWEFIGVLTAAFAVPAIVLGRVIQRVIVLARGRREKKMNNACTTTPTQTGDVH